MTENEQQRRVRARQKAQNHFTSSEQRDAALKKEMELDRERNTAKISRLRALRLAKEAAAPVETPENAKPVKRATPRPRRQIRRIG